MKPGWKTTEFWLSMAANTIGLLGVANQLPLPDNMRQGAQIAGGIITAVTTAAYTIGRSLSKSSASPAP